MKVTLLVIFLLLSEITVAQVTSFSGLEKSESEFLKFVVQIKQLTIGKDSQDKVSEILGNPHEKSKDVQLERWKFNFLVKDDSNINLKNNLIEKDKGLYNQANSLLKQKPFNKLEFERISKTREKIQEQVRDLAFGPFYQVSVEVAFPLNGRLSSIKVEKITQTGSEIVYSQSSEGGPETPPEPTVGTVPFRLATLEQHPSDPVSGELYLNTSDGHFYGWNGKEWRQLDNASGGRFLK